MNTAQLALLAALLATLIWGATPAIAKLTFQELPPFVVAFIRFAWAAMLLVPILVIRDEFKKIHLTDYPRLTLLALLGVTLSIGLFFIGLSMTSALDAGIIISTGPLFNTIAAKLFLKEKVDNKHWLGTLLATIGTVVIVVVQPLLEKQPNFTGNILGNLILLLSVISSTSFNILSKESFKKYNASVIIGFSFVIGALSFLPLAIWETWQQPTWSGTLSNQALFGLIFLALFSSLTAYLIYEWALEKLPVTSLLPMTYIQPMITIIIAVPVLHEKITNTFVLGSILILVGMFLATFRQPHHHHHHRHI